MTTDTVGAATGQNSNSVGFESDFRLQASASGTLQTLGVNVQTAAGNARLAIYSDNAGALGTLQTSTASTAVALGWNDFSVASNISITKNTFYWLGYIVDNNSDAVYNGGNATYYQGTETYPAFSTNQTSQSAAASNNLRMTYTQTSGNAWF